MDASDSPDVLVIGSGVAGLGAALTLEAAGSDVRVVDANPRPGGVIQTLTVGGYRVERSANTFRIHAGMQAWLEQQGLANLPVEATPESRSRWLYHRGRLEAVPTGPVAWAGTRLLSGSGKRRLLREPFVSRGDGGGESVAEFVDRRLGSETRKALVGPFLTGVYAGDETYLGAEAVFPGLVANERRYGSIAAGVLADWVANRRRARPRGRSGSWSGPDGMSGFVHALATRLRSAPKQRARVVGLRREASHWLAEIRDASGETSLRARAVVVAVPAPAAAPLLSPLDGEVGRALAGITYAPILSLGFGADPAHVRHPIEGFGFLVPREARLGLLGCLFMSRLFADRAPRGRELLHVLAGGVRWPEAIDLPDDLVRKTLLGELDRVLGLRTEPELVSVTRWQAGVPQPRAPPRAASGGDSPAASPAAWPGARRRLPRRRLRRRRAAFRGPSRANSVAKAGGPLGLSIGAGRQAQVAPAQFPPLVGCAESDFLERLEAIGDEGRAQDGQAFDAAFGQFGKHLVGKWLDPPAGAQPGLEADRPATGGQVEFACDRLGIGKALGAVAVAVAIEDAVTAIRGGEAEAFRWVAGPDLASGKSVKAHEYVFGLAGREGGFCRARNGLDPSGIVVEGAEDRDRCCEGAFSQNLLHPGRYRTGRRLGELGEEGNHDQASDAGRDQPIDGSGHRRLAVSHPELDVEIPAQFFRHGVREFSRFDQQR